MEKEKKYSGFKDFLAKKNIEFTVERYLLDALKFMAFGLFGTLLMGSILNQVGILFNIPFLSETVWPVAQSMTGPAIAVAVAYSLKAPPLVMFSITIGGALGNSLGGPAGAFIAAVVGTEFGKAVAGETKVDILVTPFVTMIIGALTASVVGPPIGSLMTWLGDVIMWATIQQPIIMGAVIAVVVGIVLTLPISSAALCIMLGLSGLAAGAATVGCCCQMVGFAVQSFKDNGVGGLAAQGIGTSMIQMPNIIKNYRIWIPPTLASLILGPLATTVFQMKNTSVAAGMGTCGFVGQIGTVMAMTEAGDSMTNIVMGIALLQFIFPALLTYLFYRLLYAKKWIKDGDMKLDL
ncbi:PTS sugar transporter subunit IIC [Eubacteriaceae bacterium ES3]|nr:PTS sugar transporter subunit IIC [Eubacteriaceae bacterium ES3]